MDTAGIAVLVPYFNPVGYRSHPRKLSRSLDAFRLAGIADQVYVSGAGALPPLEVNIAFWDEECPFLWHKERLINLAAERLPERYTHIVWADSDVLVEPGWIEAVAEAFRAAPVVQGFRAAHYVTPEGVPSRSRVSALRAGDDGAVGLCWGARRDLFSDGPGLFDLSVVGGGDSIFGRGLLDHASFPSVPWLRTHRPMLDRTWSPQMLRLLDAWLAEANDWISGSQPVAAETEIQVVEHGEVVQRRYTDRHALISALDPAVHLIAEPGRVFQWSDLGYARLEPAIRGYFYNRAEDDSLLPAPEPVA